MPTLYLVATPIGNLEDITLRALRVLKEVSLIAAEDTRTTRQLLKHYSIRARITSYNDHNKSRKLPGILAALQYGDLALTSDAGTPVVSDPGLELVSAAVSQGATVVSVPGPSAVTTALAVSGFHATPSLFLGFLPSRPGERRRLLRHLTSLPFSLVVFEGPHRLHSTLEDMLGAFGERRVAICRELTKLYEEVFRGDLSEALEYFIEPRGEFTLVIEGRKERGSRTRSLLSALEDDQGEAVREQHAREALAELRKEGVKARGAVALVARITGLSRRHVYRIWLEGGLVNKPIA
jgi:16S rRNA (cytidine1402-2'-O)-methyltransferase